MGTRHLICVVKDERFKVAQYGQWDGYPDGQGLDILEFLTGEFNRPLFEVQLDKNVSWITEAEAKAQWKECGAPDNSDYVSISVSDKHTKKYPENSRDTGAKLLSLIQNTNRPLKLQNSLNFAAESLFCEWAYVIDLDNNTLEVYEGFNKSPLPPNERFSSFESDKDYYPVKLSKIFNLNNLPSKQEFTDAFKEAEEI